MGIGVVPDAVLAELRTHRHLGVHTEMFSDGLVSLIESGVVTNTQKRFLPGVTAASFVIGSRRLYDFVHDNPAVHMHPSDLINSPANIARNDDVVAINSCIELDLSGQVCSDTIGHSVYSGVGGQVDFERGARLSHGGVPIIAVSSRTGGGIARIVPTLRPGAGVVTSRAHVSGLCGVCLSCVCFRLSSCYNLCHVHWVRPYTCSSDV